MSRGAQRFWARQDAALALRERETRQEADEGGCPDECDHGVPMLIECKACRAWSSKRPNSEPGGEDRPGGGEGVV